MATVGDTVANYRITGVIGRGAMATVFRAHDERLNRDVALKLLDPSYALDFIFRARFEREYRVAAQLKNDHIVPVYDAGTWEDQLYIAMMLVDGPNLGEVMKADGPLELSRVASIVTQVADALDEAHEHRIIHRDVKPANILLVRHGQSETEHAYLADFGLTLGMEGTHLTRTGGFMGTLAYSSPEQLSSAPIDGRADEYALAATAFQMLTGELPFPRENEMALVNAHLFDAPPLASDVRPDLPLPVANSIVRAMAKRPEDRFRTAGEFAKALSAAGARAVAAAMPVAASSPRFGRVAIVPAALGVIGALGLGAVLTLIVLAAISSPPPSGSPSVPPTNGGVAVVESTPSLTPTAGTLPPLASPSSTPSAPTLSPPPSRTPRPTPRPTPSTPATPPPTPPPPTSPPPPDLPLVAEGTWSVDNSPRSISGDPYLVIGEHHRRYKINSDCPSVDDCRLIVDTFDSDTGARLGTITFKWNGDAYIYRGSANWYSKAGGSTCQTSSGDLIDNAYATHEEVHVAPSQSQDGLAVQMTGGKTISGTPTAAGEAAGCAPFEMTYDVAMQQTG